MPNIYILNTEDQSENEKSTDEKTTEKEQVNPIPLPQQNQQVTARTINIAHSLVDTCLSQLCKLYLMTHVLFIFTTRLVYIEHLLYPHMALCYLSSQERENDLPNNLNKYTSCNLLKQNAHINSLPNKQHSVFHTIKTHSWT